MKIGIFGGTFDPVHLGHLKVASAALNGLKLDKLVFMPCFIPPHKKARCITPPQDRLQMIRLAIENQPKYELSDYEISRRGISFSAEMLADFKKTHPNDELFFIIGSDSYIEFPTWKGCAKIPGLASLAVAGRPLYSCGTLKQGAIEIKMTPCGISSSEIRSKLKRGESIKDLVSKKVRDYIADKKLYGDNLDNS